MGIKNLYKRGMMGLCGVAVYAMAALTMTVTLDVSTVAAHGERS